MIGSETGDITDHSSSQEWSELSRLDLDYGLQCLVLVQVGLELEAELRWQNQLIYDVIVEEVDMQDVKQAASGIKDFVAKIKTLTANAQAAFTSEGNNAITNANNLMAAAGDLRDANKMMEEALGATGSNFPPSEPSSSGSSGTPAHADINGVTLNKGA